MKKILITIILVFTALFYFSVSIAQDINERVAKLESIVLPSFLNNGHETLTPTFEKWMLDNSVYAYPSGLKFENGKIIYNELYKTPSGISYYKFGNGPDVIVYFDGYSSSPNPLGSAFYKSFLPSIQSKVTCYLPIPLASSGWEKPWNGTWIGTDFLNFVADQHATGRIFVTGFSAGGDSGYIYGAKRVTAFASVAGSDLNNYNGMMNWRDNGIPVWAFIGTTDNSENSRANCEKTWISWFDPVGDLKLTYVTGGHGSVDDYAYNPVNGLWEWFDSIGKQPVPPPLIDDQGKAWYYSESEKVIIFETVNGKRLRVTPD